MVTGEPTLFFADEKQVGYGSIHVGMELDYQYISPGSEPRGAPEVLASGSKPLLNLL
jgi:hypothetical protein